MIYVDDMRPVPYGMVGVRTGEEAITRIYANWSSLELVSLDHDLGADITGYDVAKAIEDKAAVDGFNFIVCCHSMNPVGRRNINACIESMQRFRAELPPLTPDSRGASVG